MITLFKKLYHIRYVADGEGRFSLIHTRKPLRHVQELIKNHKDFELRTIKVIK